MSLSATLRSLKIDNAWKVFAVIMIVNILQSLLSPLLFDEAYYWVYAQKLSWGYLDHPPMIGLLVKLGIDLFPGEIGVRIFSLITGGFTLFFAYRIIEEEADKPVNYQLAALLLFSSLFLNIYTFLAIPDNPMLFFGVLFLYIYRKYLQNDNLLNTLLLALVAALLLYSKYQGILVIGFTVISNLKLLGRRSFYIVAALTVILLIPHIYWEVQNDYATIRFQLFGRASLDATWHDYDYWPKQFVITGPVILLLFSVIYRTKNLFQKALKYNVIGVFIFFFISSLKEPVNMHWTAIVWPPMLCLAYLYIVELKKYRQYINALLILNIAGILVLRIDFITNTFRAWTYNEENPQLMSDIIQAKSKGHPLVFEDMYNAPSFYMFYKQPQKAYAVNEVLYKKSVFNYMPELEKEFRGKTVSVVSDSLINNSSEQVSIPKGKTYYVTVIPNFTSFSTGVTVVASDFKYANAAETNVVSISIKNTLDTAAISLLKRKGYLQLTFISGKTGLPFIYKSDKPLDVSVKEPFNFTFKAPVEKGKFKCTFSVMTSDSFMAEINSNAYDVIVR